MNGTAVVGEDTFAIAHSDGVVVIGIQLAIVQEGIGTRTHIDVGIIHIDFATYIVGDAVVATVKV